MAKQNFDKFINKEVKGAKKKEQIKQEKKQVKKEREAFFIEKKREQRALKKLQEEQNKAQFERKKGKAESEKPNSKSGRPQVGKSEKRITSNNDNFRERPSKPGTPGAKSADFKTKSPDHHPPKKDWSKPAENHSAKKDWKKSPERPGKPAFEKKPSPGFAGKRPATEPFKHSEKAPLPLKKRENINESPKQDFKLKSPFREKAENNFADKTISGDSNKISKKAPLPFKKRDEKKEAFTEKSRPDLKSGSSSEKASTSSKTLPVKPGMTAEPVAAGDLMPLNKYIAHGGICSRRDAGELVKLGKVTVNGSVVTEPGTKVNEGDIVTVNGKKVHLKQTLVYILLNKPKDYITTAEDPQGRKTVLDIVKGATTERIFPVGRLDRNTSGVLLLTNDGDLAQELTHPSYEVRKIYEAKLDKPLTKSDFTKLITGVQLEDGFVQADSVAYADSKDKSIIGIEIHSGRNRVVRRMFEHLGYDVKGLDRVMFANLTKKNVDRGKWRFLSEKEVRLLKFFKSAKR